MINGQGTRRRKRLVRDAMQYSIVGVVPEMTVRELIQVLVEDDVAGLPVLDPQGKAIGMVSVRDVLRCAAQGDVPFDRCRVRDFMVPVERVLSPGDTLETAARLLRSDSTHPLLVKEGDMLVGIITPADVLRAIDWNTATLADTTAA